jgi:hypothetical protein
MILIGEDLSLVLFITIICVLTKSIETICDLFQFMYKVV